MFVFRLRPENLFVLKIGQKSGQIILSAEQLPSFGGGERGWRCARARYLLRAALNAYLACAGQTIPSVRRSLQSKKETVLSSLFQCSFLTPHPELRGKQIRRGQSTCHHNVRLPNSLSTSMREQKYIMTPIHFFVVALSASRRRCRSPFKSRRCNRCELRLPAIPPASLIMKICARG